MPIMKKTEIVIDHKFDPKTCRHTVNGICHALHCHHYASLYTQLAEDAGMLDGKKLLSEVAEDSFNEVLVKYYKDHEISDITKRIFIAEQYYTITGLGKLKVKCAGTDSGEIELFYSHVDQGWIKKWGKRDKAVNFITQGYIAGMFSAIFDRSCRTFSVTEYNSIVTGEETLKFEVVLN